MAENTNSYSVGQCWLSDAEPDLGLGFITEVEARKVVIDFPSAGQQRQYASENAPLVRVIFDVGDRVRNNKGSEGVIKDVTQAGDCVVYLFKDVDGNEEVLTENRLDASLKVNRPLAKLQRGRINAGVWFELRYKGWSQLAGIKQSQVYGLAGARVDLLPHQLYIASQVCARHAPRILLADEVGLGKTIEAGLILHALLQRGSVGRVLLVVPDALVHQWLVEMLRRFNLKFSIFDEERLQQYEGENPFMAEQLVLCSESLIVASPETARHLLDGDWDLLVVDEAHHLEWNPEQSTLKYDLVDALAQATPGVLLLTATPEQLGLASHFSRLRLLDPDRFHSFDEFTEEERLYEPVAEIARKLIEQEALDQDELGQLDELGLEQTGQSNDLLQKLIDQHGTGRVMFRNTRSAIKGFPERRLHTYELECPDAYKDHSGIQGLCPELLVTSWQEHDPRLVWLADFLEQRRDDKVLLICKHAATSIQVRDWLMERHGIHAALFNEQMDMVSRDRAAAYFADMEEGSRLLICSEIGSEGRNFQFAHHLVLFDLPLKPDLLEQRIGRLDRIGQSQTVEIHCPVLSGGPQEILYRWYAEGLEGFEQICPAASAVYVELSAQLEKALSGEFDVDDLVNLTRERTSEINLRLESGRDRLLEMHSHQPELSAGVVEGIQLLDQQSDLRRYMETFWDAFGLEHEPGPGHSTVVRPGNHMLHDNFPELPAEGASLTFSRSDALVHEDRQFITWEHPMVQGALDMLLSSDRGSTSMVVCELEGAKSGGYFVECLFLLECSAPQALQTHRFLPSTCIRLLIDSQGNDCSAKWVHEDIRGFCLTKNKDLKRVILAAASGKIESLVSKANQLAIEEAEAIKQSAIDVASAQLQEEIQRLQDLARVNPNVREDEMDYLALLEHETARYIQQSSVRLDAIRVCVAR